MANDINKLEFESRILSHFYISLYQFHDKHPDWITNINITAYDQGNSVMITVYPPHEKAQPKRIVLDMPFCISDLLMYMQEISNKTHSFLVELLLV